MDLTPLPYSEIIHPGGGDLMRDPRKSTTPTINTVCCMYILSESNTVIGGGGVGMGGFTITTIQSKEILQSFF